MKKQEQIYAVNCMKNGKVVVYGEGKYKVNCLIFRVLPNGEEQMTVQLDDVSRINSSITVGLEELYEFNNNN